MSIIKCTECGKEFSDKANCCPNCNCPTKDIINDIYKNSNTLCINDYIYDVSEIVDYLMNGDRESAYNIAEDMIPHNLGGEITDILNYLEQGIFLPWHKDELGYLKNQIMEDKLKQKEQRIKEQKSIVPHCPSCGSTNIEKISFTRKSIGFLAVGILSPNARSTFKCKNCGYKW